MNYETWTLILSPLPHFLHLPPAQNNYVTIVLWVLFTTIFTVHIRLSTYYFPIAPVTDYHKISILKQHTLIIVHLGGSDVPNGSYRAKIKGCILPRDLRRESGLSLLQPLGASSFQPLLASLTSASLTWHWLLLPHTHYPYKDLVITFDSHR